MWREGLFQFSVDNALEIMVVFDADGTITYANQTAKRMLEYDEELCGCQITDILPGVFDVEHGVPVLMPEENRQLEDVMAYRKNRTCFPVRGKLVTHNKLQRSYICTVYDASKDNFMEKKIGQVEQEAEQALRVKSEFVANVTHELRTPVNGILGNTQALIHQETDEEKLRLLYLVERGCRDMNAIINNILDFSKLEAGKFVLEPRRFDFRNMIDYVKGNHTNKITEKGLDFSITVSPEIPDYIVGDELRIVQVLNNLISNAYKFTSVGSIHVEVVKTAQSGKRLELFFMVIDTGVGIAKADQDKLFKSFSQVDASISRKYGGTGLGLNICKQLIELMGGNIHVESDAGKGSIFSFHIWVERVEEDLMENGEEGARENQQESGARTYEQNFMYKLQGLTEERAREKIWTYGEQENRDEIEKKMSRLILCVEMENWEKAEMFVETVKQLLEGAPREVKSAALRLKMAVQKGDYEKTTAAFENLQKML